MVLGTGNTWVNQRSMALLFESLQQGEGRSRAITIWYEKCYNGRGAGSGYTGTTTRQAATFPPPCVLEVSMRRPFRAPPARSYFKCYHLLPSPSCNSPLKLGILTMWWSLRYTAYLVCRSMDYLHWPLIFPIKKFFEFTIWSMSERMVPSRPFVRALHSSFNALNPSETWCWTRL